MAQSFNTNIVHVAKAYLKMLKVPVTETTLRRSLEENPFYPSLYSLSNTFDRFHIPHRAFAVEKEWLENLTTPPPPAFIAYLKNQPTGKDFVLVTSVNNETVNLIAQGTKSKSISREAFLKDFQNIVLQIDGVDAKSGEKDYALNHQKEIVKNNKTNALIGAGILLFIATCYYFLDSLPDAFMLSALAIIFIKSFGLAVSVLLLIYEIDKSNAFVKSICSAGRQTNCNAVLQSNAAKILGMSWSEAGFFYFASTLLFCWFPGIDFPSKIFILSLTNLIAAPYILFSVYYQWKVVKQWCPLCLTVQVVLLAELVWSIFNYWLAPYLPSVSFITIALPIVYCLAIPIALWYVIKPLLLKAKNEPIYNAAYKRLLYNPDTFNNLLQQQASAPAGYEILGITIGNPDAPITIIKVCNPYCGPCARAHAVIDEILENNIDIKLKLIFTATNDSKDSGGIVARHLMAISNKDDQQVMKKALDEWYLADKKDYEIFAAKYPMNGEIKEEENAIEKMRKWCDEAEILGTPTFYINGKRLPETYNINELKYIF